MTAISHQASAIRAPKAALTIAALLVAVVAPYVSPSDYTIVLLNMALMYGVVVVGLNFIYGFGGVFSLAQAAFWGIGAYTSAILTVDFKLPFLAGFGGAIVVTALFGLLLGVPTLKLRSHYLTMATLAFAEAIRLVFINAERITHGATGIRGIPKAALGPLTVDNPYAFYYLNLAVVLAAVVATIRFRDSRLGRALQATRDDEMAAGASGVNVTHARVLAFVLSAVFGGVGGSLWAHFSAYIAPETFDLFSTIKFVAMLLIGGAGTAIGPVLGALLLTYLPEWLRFLEAWYMAVYGLSIVLILIFAPRGLVGVAEQFWKKWAEGREMGRRGDTETRRESEVAKELGSKALLNGRAGGSSPLAPAGQTSVTGHQSPDGSDRSDRSDRSEHPTPSTQLITHHPSLITPDSAGPILRTEGLTMVFGGLVAVDSVGLSVSPGEVRGIIGPNGSGKTTFLNIVSGIYRPAAGEIYLDGQQVTNSSPDRLVAKGIARTFQNIRLFPRLTVLDNVKVARYCRTHSGTVPIFVATPGVSREERDVHEKALEALRFVGLEGRARNLPGDLPYGQQRLVEIARALATEPRLLLLDEPAAGMSLEEKRSLVRLVRSINDKLGISVIVIEHDMRIISGLCHRVMVLNFGKVIAEGTPDEVRGDAVVVEAYLGRGRRRAGTR